MSLALLPAMAALALTATSPGEAPPPGSTAPPAATGPRRHLGSELELYLPVKSDRRIESVFANATLVLELPAGFVHFFLGTGLSATAAWGRIIQSGPNLELVRYATAAGGVGPMFWLAVEPLRISAFSMLADMVGSILLYSSRFPPGGDIYNFSLRFGGALAWRPSRRLQLSVGVRWMHVSNGQGLGPHNPSYEGVGFRVGAAWRL